MRRDRSTRLLNGGRTVLGGHPLRALRLSAPGAAALAEMLAGREPATPAERSLMSRMVDAGILHPAVSRAPVADVTVVIPVRDRPGELDRCLAGVGPGPARVVVVDDGSADPEAVAAVCRRHGAELIARHEAGGPAAARNAAMTHVDTALVAFLDSDCVPTPGWLEILCGALLAGNADVVAPRIQPLPDSAARRGAVDRYAAMRSPLDLGDEPGPVRPGGRTAYLPSAALLMRRQVLGAGFDPALRYGEDVDLIWRLHDAGWRIRYEPAAVVHHAEPVRLRALLARRFRYGTSAGPLARRHPGRLAPLVLHRATAGVLALAAVRRPRSAALATAAQIGWTTHRLRRTGLPPFEGARVAARGAAVGVAATGRAATMLLPLALAAGLTRRRTRPLALTLALAEPLRSWVRLAPELDPVRWTALALADDVAYGAGVWVGALRSRTMEPLTPVLTSTRGTRDAATVTAADRRPLRP